MEPYKKITINSFKPYYGIFGDANFLKDRALAHFKKQFFNQPGGELNFDSFDAEKSNASQIIDCCRAVPMLAKARLVEVRDTDSFKVQELKKFVEYFKKPVETTCLLFLGIKSPQNKKFFKVLNKEKVLFEYNLSNKNSQKALVKRECKNNGYKINAQAVEMFVSFAGEQDFGLALEKLFLYKGERKKITGDDIIESVGTQGEAQIFKFVDNFFTGNLEEVLEQVRNLLDNKNSPIQIISLLARQLRFILYFKSSKGQMHPRAPAWLGGKFARNNFSNRFSYKKLYHCHNLLYEADRIFKSTNTEDILVLENLIFNWFTNPDSNT